MKICTNCGLTKDTSSFSSDKRKKSGLQSWCKKCSNEANLLRYKNSEETRLKKKEYDKKYVDNNRKRKYYNNQRWNELNRESIRQKQRSRKRLERHKVAAHTRKRQAAKLLRTPRWLSQEQLREIEQFYWLARDLETVTGEFYHVDHIVPLQGKLVSGLHVPWNLQVIPSDINESKGNKFEQSNS